MRGYLSVTGAKTGRIPVDSEVEIFRDPEDSYAILARTPAGTNELGVSDVTVSRLKNGTAPIIIDPRQSCIEIKNQQNKNGVTVSCDGDVTELDEGYIVTVDDTATIDIGHQTELRLTVEREAKQEFNVDGNVGEFVAGNQQNIDNSTNLEDVVTNRSHIGATSDGPGNETVASDSTAGDTGPTEVEDSIVQGSDIGGETHVDDSVVKDSDIGGASEHAESTDTQDHCQTHNIVYSGDECPKCAPGGVQSQSESQETSQTKYCMFCGATIPTVAAICPECGEQLPDA